MENTILKETENFTAYRTIGGDYYIEGRAGERLCLSGASPEDCHRWEQWAEDANEAALAAEYADNPSPTKFFLPRTNRKKSW